jgi:hypothetical protein
VFSELTAELLDLSVEEKGYRHALFASSDGGGAGCSGSSCALSSSLSCCRLCW